MLVIKSVLLFIIAGLYEIGGGLGGNGGGSGGMGGGGGMGGDHM